MGQEVLIRVSATETASPTLKGIADAIEITTKRVTDSMNDMVKSGRAVKGAFDPITMSISKVVNAKQELVAKVRASTVALDDASRSMRENARAAADGHSALLRFTKGIAGGLITYKLVSMAINQIKGVFSGFADAAIGFNARLEQNRIAFTKLLGSAEAAEWMIEKMFKFAAETPFEFTQVVDATRYLLAVGFAAQDVIPMITAIGNAAAGLATGALGIERMSLALGQMMAKGKVQGQELRQLGEAGIKVMDIMRIVADKYKVSLAKVIAMQEAGEMKAQDFIDAFKEYSKLKFGDSLFAQMRTFVGAMTTISDNVRMLIAKGFEPLFKKLSEGVVAFAEFTKTDKFMAWSNVIKTVMTGVMDAIDKLIGFIKEHSIPIFAGLGAVVAAVVVPALLSLSVALLKVAVSIIATMAPLALLGAAVALLAVAWSENWFGIQQTMAQVLEWITKALYLLADAFGQIGVLIADIWLGNWDRMQADVMNIAGGMLNFIAWVLDGIGKIVMLVLSGVSDAFYLIFNELPTPVQKALENMLINISRFLDWCWSNFKTGFGFVLQITARAWTGVWDIIGRVLATIANKLADFFAMLPGGVGMGWSNLLREFAGTVGSGLGNLVTSSLQTTLNALSGLGGEIGATINGLMQNAAQQSSGAGDALFNLFSNISASINGVIASFQNLATQASKPITFNMPPALAALLEEAGGKPAKKVKDKAKDAVDKLRDPLAEAASLLKQITGAIDAALATFSKLAKYDISKETFAKGWELLLDQIKRVITDYSGMLADFGFQGEPGAIRMASLQAFGDTVNSILGSFSTALDALGKIKSYVSPVREKIDQAFNDVIYIIGRLMAQANEIKKIFKWDEIKSFADTANQVLDLFAAGLEILSKLKDYTRPARAIINAAFNDIIYLAGKLIAQGNAIKKVINWEGINTFASTAGVILQTFATGIETLSKIKEYTSPARSFIDAAFNDIIYLAGRLIAQGNAIKKVIDWETVNTFVQTATNIFNMFASGLTVLSTLDKYTSPAQSAIDAVIADLTYIAGKLIAISKTYDEKVLKLAQTFAETVGVIANAIGAAVDSMQKAAEFKQVPVGAFGPLADAINRWVTGIVWLSGKFRAIDLTAARDMAATATAIGQMITAIIEPLAEAAKFKPVAIGDFGPLADAINRWVTGLVWLSGKFKTEGLASARDMAATMAVIGQMIAAVMTSLAEAAKFKQIPAGAFGPLADAINRWVTGMVWLASKFKTEGLTAAKDMAGAASAIGQALDAVMEPFKKAALFPMIPLGDFFNIADAIVRWVKGMAYMKTEIEKVGWKLSDAKDMAEVTSSIGNALTAVMDAFAKAGTFKAVPENMWLDIEKSINQLVGVMLRLKGNVGQAVEQTKTFAADLSTVVGAFGDVLDVVSSIYTFVDERKGNFPWAGTHNALTWIAEAAESIVLKLSGMQQGDMASKVVDVKQFATDLSLVASPFKTIVDMIAGLYEFVDARKGVFPQVDTALTWMVEACEGIVVKLAQMQQGDMSSKVAGVKDFAKDLGTVLAPISTVVSVTSGLLDLSEEMKDTGIVPLTDAIAQLDVAAKALVDQMKIWIETIDLGNAELETDKLFLVTYAENLGAVLSPMSSVISVTSGALDLTDKLKKGTVSLDTAIAQMDIAARKLVAKITTWLETLGLGSADLETGKLFLVSYAENLGAVLSPMSTVISVTSGAIDLAAELTKGTVGLDAAIAQMHEAATKLVARIKLWAGGSLDLGDVVDGKYVLVTYADALSSILSPMSMVISVTSGAVDLAGNLAKGTISLDNAIGQIDLATRGLIEQLRSWMESPEFSLGIGNVLDPENNNFIIYADVLSRIMAPFQTIVSVASGAADLATEVAKGTVSLDNAIEQINIAARGLIAQLLDWMVGDSLGIGNILDLTQNTFVIYSEALSRILSPMQAVISVTSGAIDLADRLEDGTINLDNAMNQMDIAARSLVDTLRLWSGKDGINLGEVTEDGEYVLARYADALSQILSPMQTVISVASGAVDFAARLKEGTISLIDAVGQMDIAARALVDQIMIWLEALDLGNAELETGKLFLVTYAENLSAVLAPMQSVISVASGAVNLAEELLEGTVSLDTVISQVDIVARALVAQVAVWLETLDLGNTDLKTGKLYLATFAENLGAILSPMAAVISITSGAIGLAAELEDGTVSLETAMNQMDSAVDALIEHLRSWAELYDLGPATNNPMVVFSDLLGRVLAPMQTVVSITSGAVDLAVKLESGMVSLEAAMMQMDDSVFQLLWHINRWKDLYGAQIGTSVKDNPLVAFADVLNAVLSPMQTVISIASSAVDLAEKLSGETVNLEAVMMQLGDTAGQLISTMQSWQRTIMSGMTKDEKEALVQFAVDLSAILSPMSTVVSVTSSMLDLAEKLSEGLVNLEVVMSQMGDVVYQLVGALKSWKNLFGPDVADKDLLTFAENLSKALAPIQTAISITSSLINLSEELENTQYNWKQAMEHVVLATIEVINAMQTLATPEYMEKLKKFTDAFASGLNNAFSPIKNAIDALNAIKTYTGFARAAAGEIPVRIKMLVDDVKSFMQAFSVAAADIKNSPEMEKFGAAMTAIVGPVKGYIDAFYWISRYTGLTSAEGGTPPQFTAIATDIRNLILEMYQVVTGLDVNYPGAIDKVKTFSEKLKPLFDVLKSATEFFNYISDYGNQDKLKRAREFSTMFLETVKILVADFNAAGGVVETLTVAMFDAGKIAGDALIEGIIAGVNARIPDLIALAQMIANTMQTNLTASMNTAGTAAAGTAGLASTGGAGIAATASSAPVTININFTGDINPSDPGQVEDLAQRVAQVIGELAVLRQNTTVPSY